MHLRIPLPFLVLVAPPRSAFGLGKGGAGSSDQGGIDDRALFHGHAVLLEMGFHSLEDLPSKFILLKQVSESAGVPSSGVIPPASPPRRSRGGARIPGGLPSGWRCKGWAGPFPWFENHLNQTNHAQDLSCRS